MSSAVLRTPQPYINALTIFTLELRETMVKMLPEVLLDLSKISDTKAIASPMLEFLSSKYQIYNPTIHRQQPHFAFTLQSKISVQYMFFTRQRQSQKFLCSIYVCMFHRNIHT